MNTRLQVEHAVTELVTGIDLVKMQLAVAAGEPLPFTQDDIHMSGAAVECRIYAEDPDRDFMPSPGRITVLRAPGGPGVRDDIGVYEGYEVPLFYDPLLSKLSAWGRTREEAIGRLRRALSEYVIEGIKTNIPFHQRLLQHECFLSGDFDTTFVDRRLLGDGQSECRDSHLALVATAILAAMHEGGAPMSAATAVSERDRGGSAAWRRAGRRPAGQDFRRG
jgi:acetyl-CoA carboxylase biotin carboxylase subunit